MSLVRNVLLSEAERKKILETDGHLADSLRAVLQVASKTACRGCEYRSGPVEVVGQLTGQKFGDKLPKISNVVATVRCMMAENGSGGLIPVTRAQVVRHCSRRHKERPSSAVLPDTSQDVRSVRA